MRIIASFDSDDDDDAAADVPSLIGLYVVFRVCVYVGVSCPQYDIHVKCVHT